MSSDDDDAFVFAFAFALDIIGRGRAGVDGWMDGWMDVFGHAVALAYTAPNA